MVVVLAISTTMTILAYIFILNLPVLLIIIYLCTHNSKHPVSTEPIQFEHKPFSYVLINQFIPKPSIRIATHFNTDCFSYSKSYSKSFTFSVSQCQSPHMYTIDEYYDEYDTSTKLTADNVCFSPLSSSVTCRPYAGEIFLSHIIKPCLTQISVLCRQSGNSFAVYSCPKPYLLFSSNHRSDISQPKEQSLVSLVKMVRIFGIPIISRKYLYAKFIRLY